jgi:putative glutamine amidotransferase
MTQADWELLLTRLDGLLLSGGEDIAPARYNQPNEAWLGGVDEARDASELGLVQRWLEDERPLLAICRGHQLLNVALGGSLYQDIAAHIPGALDHAYVPGQPMEKPAHTVSLDPDSHLARVLGDATPNVNSAHHQAVKDVGRGLRVVGRAPDGVIEALELPEHPFCLSVQWHPEAMVKTSDTMWPLFEAFIEATSGTT